jgi:hypothetical protein
MSVTLSLFAGAGAQFLDNSGNVLTGGLIYTYSAGTTTPLATYTSNLGSSAHPNPIVLDAAGRVPGGEIWLTTGLGYKFVLKDGNNVLIGTYDNVPSSTQPPIINDASSIAYEPGAYTTAGFFKIGSTYLITSIGTTNFQLIGAASNTVGIHFIATGVGTGTGTAQLSTTVQAKLREVISVKDFGAVGDGVADDTAAIQAAIDWAVYQNQTANANVTSLGAVHIPEGTYKISSTIQLGYGETFHSVHLYGDGVKYDGNKQFCGTTLVCTFNDAPGLAVNGGRNTTIKNLTIIGLNAAWIGNNQLGFMPYPPTIDDLVASNWVDPSFPASASSQYAPYAGIAIDPYAGVQPTVHYPNVTFPSWSGITTQYGKNFSSQTLIENCQINGFVIGVANQPSNVDGNGDFTKLISCSIKNCQYGVSIGNSQSRLFRMSNCVIFNVFTGFVTAVNGKQIGKPSNLIDSTEISFSMYWLDVPTLRFGGGLTFQNCYGESIYSIGNVGQAGTVDNQGVLFQSCEWYFNRITHGVPPYTLKALGNAPVTFNNCSFTAQISPNNYHFIGNAKVYKFDNCFLNVGETANYYWEKYPVNATGGITFSNAANNCNSFSVSANRLFNLNTGNLSNLNNLIGNKNACQRTYGIPIYSDLVTCSSAGTQDGGFNFTAGSYVISKPVPVISGTTVTMDLNGHMPYLGFFTQLGFEVGDFVVDAPTETVFFVKARTGFVITMEAQNNYTQAGNLITPITSSGFMYSTNCRLYTLGFVTLGTYTFGSAVITNFQRPDGFSGYINSVDLGVRAGDHLWVGDSTVFNPQATDPLINVVGATSVTLTGVINSSQTQNRQLLFIREAPANNT